MKTLRILTIFLITVATLTVADGAAEEQVNGVNGWYIPQADGTLRWTVLGVVQDLFNTLGLTVFINPVNYYLYTKSNPTKGRQIKANSKSIAASKFNASNPTRFIIHGWNNNFKSKVNTIIRDAWLSRGDYNVIVVDWPRARYVNYINAVLAVKGVGEKTAKLIDFLAGSHGMSMDTLVLIGHSLGAHVAGFAGKNTNSQVKVIYGLDPAFPLFPHRKTEDRLNSTDAFYVETIQTNGGQLGQLEPIGKAAFYCGDGKRQPSCSAFDTSGICSHSLSYKYFGEAVTKDDFPTVKCANYKDANGKKCGSDFSGVRMGDLANIGTAEGVYSVPVHEKAPYGYGA